MRYAAGVEYLGVGYAGWQSQAHATGIQAEVEHVLSRIADHPVSVVCAGRTDAGVHALGQVIHFDSPAARRPESFMLGANSLLPAGISLRWVRPVAEDFHARYSAISRRYRYLIHNSRSRSGVHAGRACWHIYPLDAARMHAAGQCLLGEHDFSAYRAAECQSRSPVRRVHALQVERRGEWLAIEIEANAFLHHMVRNVAGVLLAIGAGRQPADWALQVLEGRKRSLGGVTADPEGLYFLCARYAASCGLPLPEIPAWGASV